MRMVSNKDVPREEYQRKQCPLSLSLERHSSYLCRGRTVIDKLCCVAVGIDERFIILPRGMYLAGDLSS